MLTRRRFAGFASCALCGIAEFIATDASAQGAPPPASAGFTQKILSQTEGPMPGYVTIIVEAEVQPGAVVPRHTHPGIESAYLLEGNLEPTRTYKAGDFYQVPTGTPHAGGKASDGKIRFTATYVVEKGKPFASPA